MALTEWKQLVQDHLHCFPGGPVSKNKSKYKDIQREIKTDQISRNNEVSSSIYTTTYKKEVHIFIEKS